MINKPGRYTLLAAILLQCGLLLSGQDARPTRDGQPARAGEAARPYVVYDTKPVILHGPYLVSPDETSVTVVWTTDTPCHSKVVYGTGASLTHEAEPAEHGLVPFGLQHAVRVTGLEPGKTYSYRAVSTRVVRMKSYWPDKGLSAESPIYTFTTFDRNKASVSLSAITDSHEDVALIKALTDRVDWKTADFFVDLGDLFNDAESEEVVLARFVDPISTALAHIRPLLFARGNHDTRGAAARSMMQYVPVPEGRFYYARDHGPVHFVVLDTGEDKDDITNVYSRLNKFKPYREEEFAWFEKHVRTERRLAEAPFRILLMHAPNWGWVDGQGDKWTALSNEAKFDLSISGHTHRFSHATPGQQGKNYHELVISPQQLVRVDATAAELKVVVTNRDGSAAESFTIPKR
jgi:acid phosphatase type 7